MHTHAHIHTHTFTHTHLHTHTHTHTTSSRPWDDKPPATIARNTPVTTPSPAPPALACVNQADSPVRVCRVSVRVSKQTCPSEVRQTGVGGGRERDRKRERETERQKERQSDRDRDTERERETHRETKRDREAERQRGCTVWDPTNQSIQIYPVCVCVCVCLRTYVGTHTDLSLSLSVCAFVCA